MIKSCVAAPSQSSIASRTHSQRPRFVRAFGWCAVALVGLELIYVLGMTAFLDKRLQSAAGDGGFHVRATSLRSWYPGDLRARSVSLVDEALGLKLTTGIAAARFDLLSLLRGSLHLKWLRLEDVAVRVQSLDRVADFAQREAQPLEPLRSVHPPLKIRASMFAGASTSPRKGMQIDRVHATLQRVQLGSTRLNGTAALTLETVHVAAAQVSFVGRAKCSGLSWTRTGDARELARGAAEVDFVWRPASGAHARANLERLDMTGSARGTVFEIASLLEWPRAWLATRGGRISANWRVEQGDLLPQSHFDFKADDAQGSAARLTWSTPDGLDLSLEVVETKSTRLQLQLSSRAAHAHVSRSSQAADTEGATFGMQLDATLERSRESGKLSIATGRLVARNVELGAGKPAPKTPQLGFSLDLAAGSWSTANGLRAAGELRGAGADAGLMVDLITTEPSVRLMLAELRDQPFHASSRVEVHDATLAFEDIALESSSISAHGGLFLTDLPARGVFMVERGAFRLGLRLEQGSIETRFSPPPGWLEDSLASLAP